MGATQCQDTQLLLWPDSCRPAGLLRHPLHRVQVLLDSYVTSCTVSSSCQTPMSPPAGLLCHPPHCVQLLPDSQHHPGHPSTPPPYCRQSSCPPTSCCRLSPYPSLPLSGPRSKLPRPGATNRTPRGPTPAPPSITLKPATPAPKGPWSYRPFPCPPTLPTSTVRTAATPMHCVQLLPVSCATPCTVSSSCQTPAPPWHRHLPLTLGDDAYTKYLVCHTTA